MISVFTIMRLLLISVALAFDSHSRLRISSDHNAGSGLYQKPYYALTKPDTHEHRVKLIDGVPVRAVISDSALLCFIIRMLDSRKMT